MKIRIYVLLITGFFLVSCSEDKGPKKYTVLFEADGTGSVAYLVHTLNCGNDLTFCAQEAIFENQSLPFKAKIEDYYSELFHIKIFVGDESEKDNLTELRITIDDKVQTLRKEDFSWWDDSPNGTVLEFSTSP